MPKIPTYTSTGSITTATPSIKSDIKLNVNQTPASALQPVSNFIRDSYIQEKTTEANNKSYKAINDFYEDQFDAQGNVCLLYTSPSPRDGLLSRMPSSA